MDVDTSTHIAMGIGLAGLAHLDPAVANQPGMTESILMATIIGSNAPDFDAIYRLKGNAAYYRRHRGASHSLPALPFWCFFVSAFAFLFNPAADYLHLLLWTSVAVVLHVAVDVFNVYGTKALYPFDKRWLAYNTIHIFDPFIMALHLAGVALWLAGLHPGYVFASVYALLLAYYFWRWKYAKMVKRKVEREVSVSGHLHRRPDVILVAVGLYHRNGTSVSCGGDQSQRHRRAQDTAKKEAASSSHSQEQKGSVRTRFFALLHDALCDAGFHVIRV